MAAAYKRHRRLKSLSVTMVAYQSTRSFLGFYNAILRKQMTPRSRLLILFASIPVVAFTLIGGYLGRVSAGEDTYRHLRIFEDVVSLISNNYVEEVELETVIQGALRGLAEGLDADSAYLSREDVNRIESGQPLPEGNVGLTVTRRYYIQAVAADDGSPAAKAGILPGDFIRAIDGEPTRFMSAVEGQRRLHGEPGSSVSLSLVRGSTQEPYDIELTRERTGDRSVSGRILDAGGIGYVRIPAFSDNVTEQLSDTVKSLTDSGAEHLVIDIRNTADGDYEASVDAAGLFVSTGTLVIRKEQGDKETPLEATSGASAISTPLTLLLNFGSSGPAEVFAAALTETQRASTVGQRTSGRAGRQKLIRLPDGTGLWVSFVRYLKASGEPIHLSGIEPAVPVAVEQPELGESLPAEDRILEKAVEQIEESLAATA